LVAGLLAQYGPWPRRLPYLVEIALLALALVAVATQLERKEHRAPWRPRRPTVPADIRRPFAVASTSAFVAWAVTGLFLALIPSFVGVALHDHDLALSGAIVAVMLGSSAVIQVAGQRLPSLPAQLAGLVVMTVGVVALVLAATTRTLAPLLVATVLAGSGQGLSFMGSLGDVNTMAPADRKADTVASFYVVIYLGTALPVIGVGALAGPLGLLDAVVVFGYVVIAICLAGSALLLAELRRPVR
jgi:hypothetical protein